MLGRIAFGALASVPELWRIASGWLPAGLRAQDQTGGGSGRARVLPVPDRPFPGDIGRTAKDSKPDFPKAVTVPPGVPNILLMRRDFRLSVQ